MASAGGRGGGPCLLCPEEVTGRREGHERRGKIVGGRRRGGGRGGTAGLDFLLLLLWALKIKTLLPFLARDHQGFPPHTEKSGTDSEEINFWCSHKQDRIICPNFFKRRDAARTDAILQQKKKAFWECDARGRKGEIEMSALAESPPEPIKRRKGFLSYFFMSLTGKEDIYC